MNRTLLATLLGFGVVLAAGAAISISVADGDGKRERPGACIVQIDFRVTATQAQIDDVRGRLDREPHVASFEFLAKEAALDRMRARFPELVEDLEYNPLPDSFQVELESEDDERALVLAYSGAPGVQDVRTCSRSFPVTEPPASASCRGVPKPVPAATVERVLRNAGFSVERVSVGESCRAPTRRGDLLVQLSNEAAGSYTQVAETEGHVDCSIYRGPVFRARLQRDLHEPPASPIFSGRKAAWWFRNVECRMYAGETHPDEQVAALDQVIERLARVTRR